MDRNEKIQKLRKAIDAKRKELNLSNQDMEKYRKLIEQAKARHKTKHPIPASSVNKNEKMTSPEQEKPKRLGKSIDFKS